MAERAIVGAPVARHRLIGRAQIAAYMDVSESTIDRWCRRRDNRPPVAIIGRVVYAFTADLDAWIAKQAEG